MIRQDANWPRAVASASLAVFEVDAPLETSERIEPLRVWKDKAVSYQRFLRVLKKGPGRLQSR